MPNGPSDFSKTISCRSSSLPLPVAQRRADTGVDFVFPESFLRIAASVRALARLVCSAAKLTQEKVQDQSDRDVRTHPWIRAWQDQAPFQQSHCLLTGPPGQSAAPGWLLPRPAPPHHPGVIKSAASPLTRLTSRSACDWGSK